ncbi:Acetoacetate--CoA ligase [Candidatus Bealeia paramacronuclearis]|uniref:Acetoacetate--CoA ligase n=1 Tax=Candidatus Bealeia paramacronuclearis TaxID=1921001 RepID=A0ABZ2C6J8_9PROT|nr:Acetoacetate--CoA ligase [Candidatus Bealeia paramacronuclearis]
MGDQESQVLWTPGKEAISSSNMKKFTDCVSEKYGVSLRDYAALHKWTVNHLDEFWSTFWDFSGLIFSQESSRIREIFPEMQKCHFFPEARLNYAENLLKFRGDEDAVVFWGEDKVKSKLSRNELFETVAKVSAFLKDQGIKPGDRVAGFVPNTPEALIAMLATASLGGVWSSCSPDFGVSAVLDRFGQIEPKFLFVADGYFYNGKSFDCLEKLPEITAGLPSLKKTIVFNYAGSSQTISTLKNTILWDSILKDYYTIKEINFVQLPFNHPLFILYSSGTTGVPKCIVHGMGGTLIQHMKEHQLHSDIKPGDRVFYFTTCGWMMWNWQVSALASGATLLLYDGSPFAPAGHILWDYAEAEKATLFGTSAKYVDALHKAGLAPLKTHKLGALRMIASTGSPLLPESFDYVYTSIKKDVCLASISGGSDIVSCFVLGNPTGPVIRGEIQTAGLGMDVDIFDESGNSLLGQKGELVCKSPFPSMPLGFWGDARDVKYKAAYFERFPGVWCHGDFVKKTQSGGFIIYGRSDAILNPGGVRIGTAEIYRQVEKIDEVLESLVVGQEWDGDVRVVLFVKLREGVEFSPDLAQKIKKYIRENTTPRHVPSVILQVPDIPRTKSGKIVELAVRDIIHGRDVKNQGALANPEALDYFKNRRELCA